LFPISTLQAGGEVGDKSSKPQKSLLISGNCRDSGTHDYFNDTAMNRGVYDIQPENWADLRLLASPEMVIALM
jgi:hypothetical protein